MPADTARIGYRSPRRRERLLSRRTLDADARHYLRIGSNGVFATRIRGFRSDGDFPGFMYFGGNADLRGYDYYQFVGQNVVYANAELRFPIIEAALTPIGVVGGVRGVFFAGVGGAWFSDQQSANPCNGEANGFKFVNNNTQLCQVTTGVRLDALGQPVFNTDPKTGLQSPALIYGTKQISGFRLQDGRASYGLGLETFMLGFPDPLRLVVANAVQQGLGRRGVRVHDHGRERRLHQRRGGLPQAAFRGLDWVPFLSALVTGGW